MFGGVLHNCFQVIGVCPFQFCGWLNPPARREFRFGFVYVFLGCLKWLKLIGSYIQRRARLIVFVLICLAKQFSRQKAPRHDKHADEAKVLCAPGGSCHGIFP